MEYKQKGVQTEMNLLAYGNGVQLTSWKVEESKPVGYCRIYYIAGGTVWYEDENGRQDLKHHSLYFFPSVKSYEIHHDPLDPIDCLWWHIDLFPTLVSELIKLDVKDDSCFCSLLETLKRYFTEDGGKTASYHSLVTAFVEYCYDHEWLQHPHGKIPEILLYMDAHYNQQIHIDEISHHFNYTAEHFIRMFQRETNFTPYQYLTHRRMQEAVKLLLQNIPVKEVALSVGYPDPNVFAYRFRQMFLISPSQYKQFYHPTA